MNNSSNLNRFFTQTVFNRLLKFNKHEVYRNISHNYGSSSLEMTNSELIKDVYNFMCISYRNEYFYKNTIFNKLLLGKHSLKTTTAFTELPINNSIADFVMINGKAIVYEIKTELDNLDRLEMQISDYYKAFDHVAIVTHEGNFEKIYDIYKDSPVGIYILTPQNTLSKKKYKKAEKFTNDLNAGVLIKLLRKSEMEQIIQDVYNFIPNLSPVDQYDAYMQMLLDLDINDLYCRVLKVLKTRYKIIENYFDEVPYELRFLVYFSNYGKKDYERLGEFLKNKIKGV